MFSKLTNIPSVSHLFSGKTASPKELADPRRILVAHFGNTVEIIQTLPALLALRHRFPHAEIAWLTSENAAPLILDHWAVNRFIFVRNDWLKHFSEIRRVRQRLQSFAPQVALDPQNSFGSSLAAWLSNAKYRIGFGEKQKRHLHNIPVAAEATHRIERNLQLLQPLGIFGSSIDFDMPECETDQIAAQNILHGKGLHGNFALLHLSADNPAARWQEERYGMVAKYLLDEWNLPSLITWSGYEQELRRAESAVHAADGAASQTPGTTLATRRSLAKVATVFISSDGIELQIAAAVGTKCVGLFGPTQAKENAPLGREHRVIQAQDFSKHQQKKRTSLLGWMDAIQPEMVCEKCDEVLAEILSPGVVSIPQRQSVQRKAA